MKTLAYITSMILIVVGILAILVGVTWGVIGLLHTGSRARGTTPLQPGLRFAGAGSFGWLAGLILPVFVFIQGLTILAIGEGLYLLAALSGKIIQPSS